MKIRRSRQGKPTKYKNAWRIRWTDAQGQRKCETYPTYQDANFALQKHYIEVEEVKRGLRSSIHVEKSFDELCDYYLKYITPEKRRMRDDISIIGKHLRPFFGGTRLSDVELYVDRFRRDPERQKLSPKTVNNILTLLIAMLNVAYDMRWIHDRPRIRKPKLIYNEYRYLKDRSEIQKFLSSAKSYDNTAYSLYATAIFTGLRQGELAGLKWSDIDFSKKLISVSRSYQGPTKSGRTRYVPLVDTLAPILRIHKINSCSDHVFINKYGNPLRESSRIFQEILHKVLELAEFPKIDRGGKVVRYLTFHDLRHTFASHWAMNGGDMYKLQRILGHQSLNTTMRYSHLSPTAFSGDLQIFESQNTKEGEVLSMF